MSKSTFLDRFKSEAVLLAVIPFMGSLAAFAFEVGYLTFYEVPYELMEISVSRIVWATLWISMPVAAIWWVCVRLYAGVTSEIREVRYAFYLLLGVSFVCFAVWRIYSQPILIAALIWIPIGLAGWGIHHFFGADGKFAAKYPEASQAYAAVRKDLERAERYELFLLGPLSACAIVMLLVCTTGYWVAKLDRIGWVLIEEPSYLLVRKYGDVYLFKEYDETSGRLKSSVIARGATEGKEIRMKKIRVPPLISAFGDFRVSP